MSDRKSHIDDNFIPEGLEFREEYMHAALGNYRRKKRAIFWGKVGIATFALLIATSISVVLLNKSNRPEQAEDKKTNSIIEQEKILTDSSSTIDLANDEGTFNKNRQSPAVESLEATQDQSTKAVDMGDPMSSGVGLPGQLSNSSSNLQAKARFQSRSESPEVTTEASSDVRPEKHNNYQSSQVYTEENQASDRKPTPSNLPYLSFGLKGLENQLQPHRPLPQIPEERWSISASIGTKLWADYGFGSGPAQLDPIVSLGAAYKWKKKLSLQLTGHFFTVSGVAAPYISTQRQYGEGFSETTYSYHTDRFYHSGISLGASYNISPRHSVGIFAESTALLTADNRVETGSSSSYETRSANEVKASGYVQGFRLFQHSIGVGYEYALGKNKSLGASYRQGLTDVTLNSFFGDDNNRNSMLSVYFKFKLK